jgi:crotonobetainyl-CoA:carnitine CoA-transferase CaiB-like acyl-CoA transferase
MHTQIRMARTGTIRTQAGAHGRARQGPRKDEPGYDFIIQAMTGYMSVTGEPDGPPQKVGVAIADLLTGLYTSTALLAALDHSQRTGGPSCVLHTHAHTHMYMH